MIVERVEATKSMQMNRSACWYGGQVEGDSWSGWEPDPERAFRDHDPALEPYASMSKEGILECMFHARGGREWEFLREFLLDKCTASERQYDQFQSRIQLFLECGPEASCFLSEVGGPATRLHGGPID
jgi:hypothetical protein